MGAIDDFFLLVALARVFAVAATTNLTPKAEVGLAGGDVARFYNGAKGGLYLYHYNLTVRGT